MSKATQKFKDDPYVKDYYQTAQKNEARMNGLDEAAPEVPAPAPADTLAQPAAPAPLTNLPKP
jgi:hypothetical protein